MARARARCPAHQVRLEGTRVAGYPLEAAADPPRRSCGRARPHRSEVRVRATATATATATARGRATATATATAWVRLTLRLPLAQERWKSAARSRAYAARRGSPHASLVAEPCWQAEVRAGDALYIPAGWWHEVLTPRCTLALNFWFKPRPNPKPNPKAKPNPNPNPKPKLPRPASSRTRVPPSDQPCSTYTGDG